MKNFKLKMDDGLYIHGLILEPEKNIKGVIQIAHGMCEHKERYIPFMKYLKDHGYVCVIHDHRGHGQSINDDNELGYFGNNKDILTDELYKVTKYIKKKYKEKDIILFGHSMGSLVARRYIANHDREISKLILCGAPTYNSLSKLAIILASVINLIQGPRKRSKLLNDLSVGNYNKNFNVSNEWLSYNKRNVLNYNSDELCGFTFTNNGFKMLFNMLDLVYREEEYIMNNKKMPIFVIGGEDDPVIGGKDKFKHLVYFLEDLGYKKVKSKLYKNMRHEILNEKDRKTVYKDILDFVNKN